MTDREMLELAARAAGYVVESHHVSGGAWVYPVDEVPNADGDYPGLSLWNPREDDGDALRLAVRRNIPVIPYDDETSTGTVGVVAKDWGNKEANTRRAILRAAAEIGRQMEVTK